MSRRVLLVAIVFVLGAGVAEAASRTDGSAAASADVGRLVSHVPVSAFNQVGTGDLLPQDLGVTKLKGVPLRSEGKPELLAMTLAWCPHCAATSWPLAIALSRFGTFSGLRIIDSGTLYGTKLHGNPGFPHTHGLSFFTARYNSAFLSFKDVVLQDVKGHNLETLTSKESTAIQSFDAQGEAPAADVGGVYGVLGVGFSPGILAHMSWLQIASSLSHPNSSTAKRLEGMANLFAAAICKVTNGRPAHVCSSSGVLASAGRLG
jgi:Domain of unknown function (DUF929)